MWFALVKCKLKLCISLNVDTAEASKQKKLCLMLSQEIFFFAPPTCHVARFGQRSVLLI